MIEQTLQGSRDAGSWQNTTPPFYVSQRPKSGRSRCTAVCDDRYLANVANNAEFQRATGRRISTQAVRSRLPPPGKS